MIRTKKSEQNNELRWLSIVFLFITIMVGVFLFRLQILQYNYYATLAMSAHEIYQKLHPNRGEIYFSDARNNQIYPASVNRTYYQIYGVPNEINPSDIASTTEKLKEILSATDEQVADWMIRLAKENDPYEPLLKKVDEDKYQMILEADLVGIYGSTEVYRYYPEESSSGALLGFCIFDNDANLSGRYGVEGYWNKVLSGKPGFLSGERSARGGWISTAGMTSVEAENGSDLVLTIDRALQYKACSKLNQAMKEYNALSASLVMVEPKTGSILAMCSSPQFDPNNFSSATSIAMYNNNSIFTAYEPGSVFKPIVMAAALDLGLVDPNTTFNDPCSRQFGKYTISNALKKCYGDNVTMTQVLEDSINTGMIWVVEKIGRERFQNYINKFGFGEKTGIPLDTEVAGNITSLNNKSAIFSAQASFGQGLTVTPIQLAMAYAAIANNGVLNKPYLVKEIRYDNGRVEKFEPEIVTQVISPRAAKLMSGMLTSVVEKSYKYSAKMNDYYVAGKTGTAQIAGPGGYLEKVTNHTFTGFAPSSDPKFVLVIRFEQPERQWAESTSAVVFKDISEFALNYFGVVNDKN